MFGMFGNMGRVSSVDMLIIAVCHRILIESFIKASVFRIIAFALVDTFYDAGMENGAARKVASVTQIWGQISGYPFTTFKLEPLEDGQDF
jgi:hypothetical protein